MQHEENYEAIIQLVSSHDTQQQILTSFSSRRHSGDKPLRPRPTILLITDVLVSDTGHQINVESARCGLILMMVEVAKKSAGSFC